MSDDKPDITLDAVLDMAYNAISDVSPDSTLDVALNVTSDFG